MSAYQQPDPSPGCGGCLLISIILLFSVSQLLHGLGAEGFVVVFVLLPFAAIILSAAAFFGFISSMRKRVRAYERSQTESHNRFVYLLVNILMSIAKADGQFTRPELHTMLHFFQTSLRYNQEQMYWVKQLIKQARDNQQDLEALLTEFRHSFDYEPRLILLELIYQIIYTKPTVLAQELDLARKIGYFLHISAYQRQTIENSYRYRSSQQQGQGGSAASAAGMEQRFYTVLGLEQGADFAAIKKAYRTLSMQYHPDKVAHLGAEFKRVAEEKMKELNAAYDYFRKKFERTS